MSSSANASRSVSASASGLRRACISVMLQLLTRGGSLSRLLPEAQARVAASEQAKLQAWCFGMARWSHQLTAIVDSLLDKPLKARDQDVHLLMQLGVFQLMHTGAADYAVVDETVKVTRALKKTWSKGLVNAVLRNFLRQRESLLENLDTAAGLSHPPWLLARLRGDWPQQWQAIAEANNQQGPMTLRVNRLSLSVAQYRQRLHECGFASSASDQAPDALQLDQPVPVSALPGFNEGQVSVQDAAAQLAAGYLTRLTPAGGRLLDACAAPGGKTAHALERQHFSSVLALDIDEDRKTRIEDTVRRLKLNQTVQIKACDALQTDTWWDRTPFSAILLDAPCSGTGVIRRHPDIKLLRRASDIAPMVETQARLLDHLWMTLAPQGLLLYATCSVLCEENEQQIHRFLQRTADADLCEPVRQILPGDQGMDGFFYAAIRKRSS